MDAVVRLGFDRQAAPLKAFLATCVEKRRGENKVKRGTREPEWRLGPRRHNRRMFRPGAAAARAGAARAAADLEE